jgi:protein-L-isoaspartate O-methyltransferase
LASAGLKVTSVEQDAGRRARRWAAAGIIRCTASSRVTLSAGAPGQAPFDVILVHGAAEVEPEALLRQLRDGGRLGIVMGLGRSGRAMVFRRIGATVSRRTRVRCRRPGAGRAGAQARNLLSDRVRRSAVFLCECRRAERPAAFLRGVLTRCACGFICTAFVIPAT